MSNPSSTPQEADVGLHSALLDAARVIESEGLDRQVTVHVSTPPFDHLPRVEVTLQVDWAIHRSQAEQRTLLRCLAITHLHEVVEGVEPLTFVDQFVIVGRTSAAEWRLRALPVRRREHTIDAYDRPGTGVPA